MKWPGTCKRSDGPSEPDQFGDRHTHVCGEDKGHDGRHKCEWCSHTW